MIEALILAIALEVGVPPHLVLAIAYTENPTLDALAVNRNTDGTLDLGVMQLNSSWYTGDWADPETNIRAGCEHIKWLLSLPNMNEWLVAVAYNCGYSRMMKGPPQQSIDYAGRVFIRFNEYRGYRW
jgi:soluble lytic murein transglycosylase-like protein